MTMDRMRLAGRRIVYEADEIRERVERLGREIADFYPPDEPLLVIGVLKGTFVFLGDLVRRIDRPLQVDFLIAESYGSGTTSSGVVRLRYEPSVSFSERHVLLVEDIVDSGTTLNEVVPVLRRKDPRSLEVCALLRKRSTAELAVEPRWVGFDAPDEFLIGYGLDHDEDYRNLPYIASL